MAPLLVVLGKMMPYCRSRCPAAGCWPSYYLPETMNMGLVEEGGKNEQVFKTDAGGNDRYLPSVQALVCALHSMCAADRHASQSATHQMLRSDASRLLRHEPRVHWPCSMEERAASRP